MSSVSAAGADLEDESRRRWLVRWFWGATALVTAGLVSPLVGYFAGPLLRRRPEMRVRLGALGDFPIDRPQRVEFVLRKRDGWVTTEGRQTAWVVRRVDDVLVFDPRCTHLACAYHWEAARKEFLCPCHNGLYALDGRVTGGPPPRPLDVYDVSVEDGALFIVPTPRRRSA